MKIKRNLYVAKQLAKLNSATVLLELFAPGRAIITCHGVTPKVGDVIELDGQLADNDMRRLFTGYVESVIEKQTGVFCIMARELAAMLNRRVVLNLRHCTPEHVLQAISDQTGLTFVLPDQLWTDQTIARFQHIGGGYMALDKLLTLWSVKRGIWHQQTNGKIYVGELSYSAPGQRTVNLNPAMFDNLSMTGGTLPLIPRLRPGVNIQLYDRVWRITSIELKDELMRLHWAVDPWSQHLQAIQ